MKRITALKAKRQAGLDRMQAILDAAGEADRDLTAEEQAEFDALKAADDKLSAELAALEDLERRQAAAARVQPLPGLPGGAPLTAPAQAKDPAEKGLRAARMVRALAAVKGIPMLAAQYAEQQWGDGQLFANQNTGTGAAGGFLVPEDVSGEIIELLRPASVVMSLSPVVIPMSSGNFTMNRVASGAQASYIGEQQDAPATGVQFGQVKLSAKKLAALIPVSNDLLRMASQQADRVVRDDMIAAIAQRTDLAFLRGTGSEFSPRGLRSQLLGTALAASNILAANATVNLANVTTDLGRMVLALANLDVPMLRPGYVLAPRTERFLMDLRDGNGNFAFREEMQAGRLNGYPYRRTTQVPINLGGGTNESEIYFADFAQVVVGEHMGLEVATSTEAAYVDAQGTMRAAFSRDETIMRGIVQHDIGLRHLAAVCVLTGVTWGA